MTRSKNDDFEFRAVLLRIQDSLSDAERRQLHFLFTEDIPRRLQLDGSVETALDVLQALFDREKISPKNFEYLLNGLKAIQRHDCAQRLKGENRSPLHYGIDSISILRRLSRLPTQ